MNALLALMTAVTLTLHVRTEYPQGVGLNTCTAVYVTPTEALTAAHCIHNSDGVKAWVRDANNRSFSATLIEIDKKNDIALLAIHGPAHPYVKLGTDVQRTERVYTLNSGEDMIGTYAEGVIANLILDPVTETPQLLHSAPILAGASGSGLFDGRGRLVGINTMSNKVFSVAVSLLPMRHLLENMALKQQISVTQGS